MHMVLHPLSGRLLVLAPFLLLGCGLFEPRSPEAPTGPGSNNRPATDASIVMDNLQTAIEERNELNYASCLSTPLAGNGRPFSFTPSRDVGAVYASVFSDWSVLNEQEYFHNLFATNSSFSNLTLTLKNSLVTADSVLYSYDYTLTCVHANTPVTARGSLQFTLATDDRGIWSIFRWIDYSLPTNDMTWSQLKASYVN